MTSPVVLSLQVALVSTAVTAVSATALARFLLPVRARWRPLVETCLLLPMVLPPTVLGYLLLLLLGTRGPVGRLLERLFGATPVFTWWGAVIAATVVSFPLMYTNARSALEQVDARLLQAARLLGGGSLRGFLRIHLPLAAPGLLVGVILSFARGLGEFGATLMLAGNLPGRTTTMPVALYFDVEAGDHAAALNWTVYLLLISFALLAVLGTLGRRKGAGVASGREL